MKKKLFIILFILVLIVVFGNKIKVKSPFKREVKYADVVEVEKNHMTTEKKEDFEDTATKIGFEKAECNNKSCAATTQQDSTSEYVEIQTSKGRDDELYSVFTLHKDEFNIDKITEKINTILNNYYGYTFTSSYIEEMHNKLQQKNGYGTEDIGVTDYIENGKYVIMFNIEYFEENYTIRIIVATPETAEELKVVYN